jgi:N,N'-diacetyllegionaminate synthase
VKRCSRCRLEKPLAQFGTSTRRRDGKNPWCKECVRATSNERTRSDPEKNRRRCRERYWRNPGVAREFQLQKMFGLRQTEYDVLLENQEGLCAICGSPETQVQREKIRPLAVDHDHDTGAVRGLLCGRCNVCIERIETVEGWGERAKAYLSSSSKFFGIEPLRIGTRLVGANSPTFIVAELGINHDGSESKAIALVDAAASAGADAVKIQLYKTNEFCSEKALYRGEKQCDLFSRYELGADAVAIIASRCKEKGVLFFGTPADQESAQTLLGLGAQCLKVGSDDIVHTPLISWLSTTGVPLLLSTGMSEAWEISEAVRLAGAGKRHFPVLFHCVSLYPTPIRYANLNRIRHLGRFSPFIGYSDHTDGWAASVGAVCMGAMAIEKHFTLDRSLPGPDHAFSADPVQFTEMVRRIREAEVMMGTGEIEPSDEEKAMRVVARRSIVAAREIMEGERITAPMLAYKRPGDGLMPGRYQEIIGKTARRSLKPDEQFREGDWC